MTHEEIAKIRYAGNSLYFLISRDVKRMLAIKRGDFVYVVVVDGELRARKVDFSAVGPRLAGNGEAQE